MNQTMEVLYQGKPCYPIHIEASFDALAQAMEPLSCKERKICIITDSKVNSLYGEEVETILTSSCAEIYRYSFPNGETQKTLDTVKDIYCFLIKHKFDRKDLLIALGGGVVGDITGFTAAT